MTENTVKLGWQRSLASGQTKVDTRPASPKVSQIEFMAAKKSIIWFSRFLDTTGEPSQAAS